jgi:hypothetical protein
MTNVKLAGWLLVALAIVGLAFVPGLVGAHGNETAADDAPPYEGTTDDWAAWMETHMTEHMGPGSVDWMESHMDVTGDEMGRDMADDDHDGGTYGQGHC